ncbi:MAG: hypothetical protein FWG30_07720 [Eubacteriaceae bacterium]|nr:hypothetical protein [Eubacteriaceae bacterium]
MPNPPYMDPKPYMSNQEILDALADITDAQYQLGLSLNSQAEYLSGMLSSASPPMAQLLSLNGGISQAIANATAVQASIGLQLQQAIGHYFANNCELSKQPKNRI